MIGRAILRSFGRWTFAILMAIGCLTPTTLDAQTESVRYKAGQKRTLTIGKMKFEVCWCPPGEFKMGDARVEVTLSRGFWMGKHEVTQAQYQSVMKKNDSRFKGASLPVQYVSWDEATEFCQKLARMEREAERLPKDWEYRLPTEAQWEYACRAGTTTKYSFGDDANQLGDYAWYRDNSNNKTHVVGQKKPNAWGLYDMHGNVWEWCRDAYDTALPGGTDPEVKEKKKSSSRVLRGASWNYDARFCGTSLRYRSDRLLRDDDIGFRVALVQSSEREKIVFKAAFREWSDANGEYRVIARLFSIADNAVRLEKKNGTRITVPLAKLSQSDRTYVQEQESLLAKTPLQALDEETELSFVSTPLDLVIQSIAQRHHLKIELSPEVKKNQPVVHNGKGKLKTELPKMLGKMKLTYVVKDDYILIQPAKKSP